MLWMEGKSYFLEAAKRQKKLANRNAGTGGVTGRLLPLFKQGEDRLYPPITTGIPNFFHLLAPLHNKYATTKYRGSD